VAPPFGDLEELDDAWVLSVELPGVKRDDIDAQLDGRRLTVRAERKQTERKGLLRRTTRTTGRYFLEVVLPSDIDPDDVQANLEDGVLTVRVAKPEAQRGGQRRIAIQRPRDRRTSG
jgi:HSP20 family protein